MNTQIGGKRAHLGDVHKNDAKKQQLSCMYGERCYRRNPQHFEEYSHPHFITSQNETGRNSSRIYASLRVRNGTVLPANSVNKLLSQQANNGELKIPSTYTPKIDPDTVLGQLEIMKNLNLPASDVCSAASASAANHDKRASPSKNDSDSSVHKRDIRKGTNFAARLEKAAPYHLFLTRIHDSKPTHHEPLAISFHNLLDPSLGDLESSLHINFMVEVDWLMENYEVYGHSKKPMMILYGEPDEMLNDPKSLPKNITAKKIKPSAFGHHHTKVSIFHYSDGSIRVVVSTANLISSDWYNRTQGVWVSPTCPRLPEGADTAAGESVTEFKADLIRYLVKYQLPALQEWISKLRRADFSDIRVFFIASVPGSHRGADYDKWGHVRLGSILKKHATVPFLLSPSKENWPIIAQCSSIGTLGPDANSWMCGELRNSFAQRIMQPGDMPQPPPAFHLIYPSLKNVRHSHDDLLGGDCLPYSAQTHSKQRWLTKHLHQWKSDRRHRTQAMPHIKTYARPSPCGQYLAWFHLTSANLSKAAWGKLQDSKKQGNSGPGLYIMSYEAGVLFLPKFLLKQPVFDMKEFPLPWDYPLTPYEPNDEPWVSDFLR